MLASRYLNIPHGLWRLGRLASSALIAAGLTLAGVAASSVQAANAQLAASAPRLSRVFVIMEENNGYHDVIGNPAAPDLTYLAKTFGVATDYFGVSPCCSETNRPGRRPGRADRDHEPRPARIQVHQLAVGAYVDPKTDTGSGAALTAA